MKLLFWLAWKTMGQSGKKMSLSSWVSLAGIVLGVASLVVSMAVMTGYEETLKNVIVDVASDAQVFHSRLTSMSPKDFGDQIKSFDKNVTGTSAFVMIEAIAAQNGTVMGAIVHGVDSSEINKVIRVNKRVIQGEMKLQNVSPYGVVVGKDLAKKLKLNVGDTLNVVIPISSDYDPTRFRRRMGEFKVEGIVDFGKFDYNERTIIADIKVAQELAELKNRFSGIMVKLKDSNLAPQFVENILNKLGPGYWARSWRDLNASIFEAVHLERIAIFFVVLVIIIVAAFNVSSSLYINVVQRYSQISLFKTLGLGQKQILWIFCIQGLFMGVVGVAAGYILGIIFCRGFLFVQRSFQLIPQEVYQLDFIGVSLSWGDTVAIILVTLLITSVSALAPALRGARLSPVEGLRYE